MQPAIRRTKRHLKLQPGDPTRQPRSLGVGHEFAHRDAAILLQGGGVEPGAIGQNDLEHLAGERDRRPRLLAAQRHGPQPSIIKLPVRRERVVAGADSAALDGDLRLPGCRPPLVHGSEASEGREG